MKVTGFTIIKDAIIYDYPILEAIRSILPICDDFIIAIGESNDKTLDLIKKLNSKKIKIVFTVWDEKMRTGGKILSTETNKAFAQVPDDSDWAFYIQADEVVHEKYLDTIHKAMLLCKDNSNIDGLLFKYLHFYGSYDYVGMSSKWYRREIRVIKNNKRTIYSYGDAQGFRKDNNKKLRVCEIDAYVYHYGWVRAPKAMQKKQIKFNSFWYDDEWLDKNIVKADEFDYGSEIKELKLFRGFHPRVIQKRIKAKNWDFEQDISLSRRALKDKLKDFFRKYLGLDFNYKNYIIRKRL